MSKTLHIMITLIDGGLTNQANIMQMFVAANDEENFEMNRDYIHFSPYDSVHISYVLLNVIAITCCT